MPNAFTDAYQHPSNLTHKYIRYAKHPSTVCTVYRHPTNWDAVGGNPCLLVFHAGSWVSVGWDQDLFNFNSPFTPNRGHHVVAASLLDPKYGYSSTTIDKTKPAFTLVSCEYPQAASLAGKPTYPDYGYWGDQAAIGRAVQYFKDNAWRWGINKDLIFTWGQSAGSCNGMVNLLSPSLPFLPNYRAGSRWDRYSSSRVAGHLNWYGEITCVGEEYNYTSGVYANPAGTNAGLFGDIPASQSDWSEHNIVPLSIQKRSSPMYLLGLKRKENVGLSILSFYAQSEDNNNSGHDPKQFSVLAAACAEAGVNHQGRIVATNGVTDLGQTIGETYAWLKGLVEQADAYRVGLAPAAF